jgi:site-specific DNA recombinase
VSTRTIKPGLRPATAIRCVGYLRLSDLRDEDLTEDGDVKSFEARETALRNFAAGLGWPVIEVIRENDFVRSKDGKRRGASAFKKKRVILPDGTAVMRVVRPGFEKALDYLRSGRANALIGEHLDRLMREPIDNERLIEIVEARKINARSLSGSLTFTDGGTDHEITTARIMVAIANQASRDSRRRVAAGRKRKADRGEWGGGPRPFGFDADGVTIRQDEAHVILKCSERVLQLDSRTERLTSLKTLARELRECGVPTCTGAQWSAETLKEILVRPRNGGGTVAGDCAAARVSSRRRPVDGSGPEHQPWRCREVARIRIHPVRGVQRRHHR